MLKLHEGASWHACGSSEQVPQVVQTWSGAPSRPSPPMPASAHLLTKPPHPLASQRCGLGTCTAACSSGGMIVARCRRWRRGRWPSQSMPPAAWTAGALLHGLLGCLVMGSTGNYRHFWAILGDLGQCDDLKSAPLWLAQSSTAVRAALHSLGADSSSAERSRRRCRRGASMRARANRSSSPVRLACRECLCCCCSCAWSRSVLQSGIVVGAAAVHLCLFWLPSCVQAPSMWSMQLWGHSARTCRQAACHLQTAQKEPAVALVPGAVCCRRRAAV